MPPRDKLPSKKVLHENFTYKDGELFWKVTSYGRTPDKPAGNTSVLGYRRVKLHQQLMFLHRVIWKMHHGTEPEYLDHIDRNTLNNRIENLREATAHENITNTGLRNNNSSGYIGVHLTKRDTWSMHVRIPGMRLSISNVVSRKEAARLYDAALDLLQRSFAQRNFPDKKTKPSRLAYVRARFMPKAREIKAAIGVDITK